MKTTVWTWCVTILSLWMTGAAVLGAPPPALTETNAAAAVQAPDPIENSDCLDCHSDKDLTKETSDGKTVSMFTDEEKFTRSVHGTNRCVECHIDLKTTHPDDENAAKPVECSRCHERQSESYGASVHGLALAAGELGSATCKDCHGAHDVTHPSSPDSPLNRRNLGKTCGECHENIAEEVSQSVHGTALAKGEREAATCTDCHSEHKIEKLKSSSPIQIAQQVCSGCHASEKINTKYNLPGNRVQTFLESYHGLAAKFGSTKAANCASCHGVHNILPSTDPRSTIHKDHLVETCGKCHPGANENFSFGQIHLDLSTAKDLGTTVNMWTRRIYLFLIFSVIGFMVLHNGLSWIHKVRSIRRHQARTILRMDRSQRVQHMLLLLSFIYLALSGFALTYPNSWLAWCLGSEDFRRWSHRIAGVLLLAVGAYHLYYIAARSQGRRLVKDLFPTWNDAVALFQNILYLIGLKRERAKIGRFGYAEKMEYWAVLWGTLIMGATGLMIWFKIDVTRFLPRWVVDVAVTIHYYEAILAVLAIIVWHLYHVIFDPDVYPINFAFLDGRVTEKWQEEEHPLEVIEETGGGEKRELENVDL